jgi:hypothetical protein
MILRDLSFSRNTPVFWTHTLITMAMRFLQNKGTHPPHHTTSHPRKTNLTAPTNDHESNYHHTNVSARTLSMQNGAAVHVLQDYTRNMLQGPDSIAPTILDLCTRGKRSASYPEHFTPNSHSLRRRVGPTDGKDHVDNTAGNQISTHQLSSL